MAANAKRAGHGGVDGDRQGHRPAARWSSVGGRTALPFNGAYHASKFGIEAVGDSLRQELRPWNLHVSLVEPCSVATPIWDKGEGEADEISARSPEHHSRRP